MCHCLATVHLFDELCEYCQKEYLKYCEEQEAAIHQEEENPFKDEPK